MTKQLAIVAAGLLAVTPCFSDSQGSKTLRTKLNGYKEAPQTLSTTGTGEFRAKVNNTGTEVSYELEYSGLEGNVVMAHIHLGAKALTGGIMVWLCGTAAQPGPAGTQVCPASGKITGTLTAANVIGPGGQGIAPGEFTEFVNALKSGAAYVNVHSVKYPSGEIRGQIDDDDK